MSGDSCAGRRPSCRGPSSAPQSAERVSFFEVPLECGAAEGLGCGSASKPVLRALEEDPRVKRAKINYAGTALAVEWNDPEQARSGASAFEAVFRARTSKRRFCEARHGMAR